MTESTHPAAQCYVALGSNLDQPRQQIERALHAIAQLPDTQLIATSSHYRSPAMGYTDQPDFINAVASVHTRLSPETLLEALMNIERTAGRERSFRNAPRTIDLDILLYNQLMQHDERLTLPHPRMHERAFVLQPLLEIAPGICIPGLGAAFDFLQHIVAQPIQRLDADLT